jgi:hypothetical protein
MKPYIYVWNRLKMSTGEMIGDEYGTASNKMSTGELVSFRLLEWIVNLFWVPYRSPAEAEAL